MLWLPTAWVNLLWWRWWCRIIQRPREGMSGGGGVREGGSSAPVTQRVACLPGRFWFSTVRDASEDCHQEKEREDGRRSDKKRGGGEGAGNRVSERKDKGGGRKTPSYSPWLTNQRVNSGLIIMDSIWKMTNASVESSVGSKIQLNPIYMSEEIWAAQRASPAFI